MQVSGAIHLVLGRTWIVTKAPALIGQDGRDDGKGDHLVQLLQLAGDQGARGPGTSERDVEVVASSLGGKAALSGRPGRAVRGHPMAKARHLADEAALFVLRLDRLPRRGPFAV